MPLTHHAKNERAKRVQAFADATGISLSTSKVSTLLRKVAQLAPQLSDYLFIIAKANTIVFAGDGSNGDMLCALICDRCAVTIMLRRSDQVTRFNNLPYVALSRNEKGEETIIVL